MTLRDYQLRAVAAVAASSARATVLVMPTGAGKTRTAVEIVRRHAGRAVWIAHREELIRQAHDALTAGTVDAAIVAPWAEPRIDARCQVCSIDTLVARGEMPDATLVVYDECAHAAASTYSDVHRSYRDAGARIVGLTATPARADGRGLRGLFDELIVGATYPELLAAGHILPCRVLRPHDESGEPVFLGSGLGRDPVEAWLELAGGERTFAFCADVAAARALAEAFRGAGVAAECVTGDVGSRDRGSALDAFRAGDVRVLTNVYVLTEGVDVPDARVCLLARAPSHASVYLQMVGRVLRPAAGKADALLIDLPGASVLHGIPTADREYSLDGRAIGVRGEPLRACPECGYTQSAAARTCEACGYEWPVPPARKVRIYSYELREAAEAAGGIGGVSDGQRRRELARLLALADARGWSAWFVVREYRALFETPPPPEWMASLASDRLKARELAALRARAAESRYRPGWVGHRYRALFGRWAT